jgi:hypothetical protein
MFLSARNESVELEDIQELIPNLKGTASPSANDMESGRGGGVAGGISTPSASTIPPSDQRAQYHRGKEEPSCSVRGGSTGSFFAKYFSVLLLMLVTASLVILPLVLPPLPPPPSMLMLVPVAMLVMLLVLAFMPTSGGRSETGPAPYM